MNGDWQVFCTSTITAEPAAGCFGSGGDITYLQWMLSAWGWTIGVAALAFVIAVVCGLTAGSLRALASRPLRVLAACWTELFRNIPVLVQVFLWYHVLPALLPSLKAVPSFLLAAVALGLFTSARIAEQVRAGIQSLPAGQQQAATAMGLSLWQSARAVILPQALRIVMPALTSEAMNLIKNSSVAFAVSVTELTLFAMQAQEETSRGLEIYVAVTALYVITALMVNRIMTLIESRTRVPGLIAVA
jgi:glutamate/aspartate transport system permease protein